MPVCVGAPGTCRTEEFTVPNAEIPQAVKSLLQPPPSAKKSLLLPAAQLSGGRLVPEISILNSACQAPANVLRNALKIKMYLGNTDSDWVCHENSA